MAEIALFASFSNYCDDLGSNFSCPFCQRLNFLEGGDYAFAGDYGDRSGATYGYGAYSKAAQRIIMTYRGTVNTPGWIGNFKFAQTNLPNAPRGLKVHSGFLEGVMQTQPKFLSVLERAQAACGGQCRVLFCGHSLGAAQSLLATAQFILLGRAQRKTLPRVDVVSFGSPRVGNIAFARWFQQTLVLGKDKAIDTTIRVVHSRDPVPHVPPASLPVWDYLHVTQEIFQQDGPSGTSNATFVVCSTNGEDPGCSDSVDIVDPADHSIYLGISTTCTPQNAMQRALVSTSNPQVPAWAIAVATVGSVLVAAAIVVVIILIVRHVKKKKATATTTSGDSSPYVPI